MCAWISITARSEDGSPYPGAPPDAMFPGGFTPDVCTCNRDADDEDGETARRILADALLPFLRVVSWGDIVIEVR